MAYALERGMRVEPRGRGINGERVCADLTNILDTGCNQAFLFRTMVNDDGRTTHASEPQHESRDLRCALPEIEAVIASADDLIANLANVAAILKQAFNFDWVGFYRTTAPHLLMLGPFQGLLACVSMRKRRLRRGRT